MKQALRQPIVTVLGHVDAGKTSLLDKLRGSTVAAREPGMMTQHIGASFFPLKTIKEICGPLSKNISSRISIPGILFIDTPGHNVFLNLRRRGGSVSDIAILVIDIARGFEVQTHESLNILKVRKTPFLVAANKLDTVPGWTPHPNTTFAESYKMQIPSVQTEVDNFLYVIMGTFSRLGFDAERFDKVRDFSKTVAIIPVSAKTGEGMPELMAILIGLTQQYMIENLRLSKGPAKGTILEVKEEAGLGLTFDAIIYEGILHKTDTIVVGGREKPVVTKIRTILLPKPLDEMRDPRDKFTPVESVAAAAGVKISAHNIEGVIAGAPLYAVGPGRTVDELVKMVDEEVEKIRVVTDKVGVILKADTLGSLEALTMELENNGIPIRLADVGDVSRREVIEAALMGQTAPLQGVVLTFNVKVLPDAEEEARTRGVPIFNANIVYHLVDEYKEWVEKDRSATLKRELNTMVLPGKIMVLPTFVFRKSKPAVFGVRVLAGRIKRGYPMVRGDGQRVGTVMQIQDQGESIEEATIGKELAVSMKEPTIGRSFDEGDVLYVAVPESNVQMLFMNYQRVLSQDDVEVLKELIEVMRKINPGWGPLTIRPETGT
ncbi:translation initiation factor IF-2 [Candidatus Bathyarchaeota archaeon]|nr:translation initiation factor IF-2 [Candidatus Bathyarchaeota archaeon]